ncbi:MAG: hypothetical protein AAGJ28_10310 [Pseudomonadota bacterium]
MMNQPVFRMLKAFWSDNRGSITIEFVFWVPLLLFTALFIIGAFLAMSSRLQAMMNSSALHHVISAQEEISPEFLTDLSNLMNELGQDASGPTELRFSSIKFNGVDYEVHWTECFGDIIALTDADIPVEIMPQMSNQEHILLVESYVPYSPITTTFGLDDFVWSSVKFVKSRDVSKIDSDFEFNNPPSGTCTG